ncbi:TMEM43 family protein [Anatilimnocola sp. NA78]|uniref:TMEM43 family protein n=1 Tax=Anatilimnocola sp. NA78 TaxID=3415683 RepID=UPI003CE4EE5D
MSNDSVSVTSNSSFGSRITGALMGVLIGPVALLAGSGLLAWNEGRTVKVAQSLDEGEKQVISVPADKVDPANNGKLVYVTGETAVAETLRDDELGIADPAIKLRRVVEMYQWTEKKESKRRNNRTVTTYDYTKKWTEGVKGSAGFHQESGHENPDYAPLHSHDEVADKVTLGAFTLDTLQVAMTDNSDNRSPRPISDEEFAAIPEEIRREAEHRSGSVYLPVGKWLPHAPKDRINNSFTPAAASGSEPQVGDVRITYTVVKPGPTTVVAKQTGTGFEPFNTKAGRPVNLLRTKTLPPHEMFEMARADNTVMAWALRGGGLVILFVGFMLLMGPLNILSEWIPVLGSLVSGGTFLIALAGSIMLGSIVIASAWLYYHPVLAIGIVLVAVLLAGSLWFLFRRKPQPIQHSSGLEIVR